MSHELLSRPLLQQSGSWCMQLLEASYLNAVQLLQALQDDLHASTAQRSRSQGRPGRTRFDLASTLARWYSAPPPHLFAGLLKLSAQDELIQDQVHLHTHAHRAQTSLLLAGPCRTLAPLVRCAAGTQTLSFFLQQPSCPAHSPQTHTRIACRGTLWKLKTRSSSHTLLK